MMGLGKTFNGTVDTRTGGGGMGILSSGNTQAQMDKDQVFQAEPNRKTQEGSDRVAQWDRDHPEGAR